MADLSLEAQALVAAGRTALRPTAADRERITAALGARVGDTSLPREGHARGGAPAPPAGGALGWPAISALVAGVLVGGGVLLYSLRAPEPKAPTSAVAATAAVPPAAPKAAEPVAPEPAPAAERLPPTEAPAVAQAQRRPLDRLAEEVAILSRAETELHAGRYQSALRVLEEHERKFPRGTLAQERVAARVRALCGLGRNAEADAALGRLSPGSVHEGRTREACAASSKK